MLNLRRKYQRAAAGNRAESVFCKSYTISGLSASASSDFTESHSLK